MTNATDTKKTPASASANAGRQNGNNSRRPANGGSNKPTGSKPTTTSTPKDVATVTPDAAEALVERTGPKVREVHKRLQADVADDLAPFGKDDFNELLAVHLNIVDSIKKNIPVPVNKLVEYDLLLQAAGIFDEGLERVAARAKAYTDREVGALRNDTHRGFEILSAEIKKTRDDVADLPRWKWAIAIVVFICTLVVAYMIGSIHPDEWVLVRAIAIALIAGAFTVWLIVTIRGTAKRQAAENDNEDGIAQLGLTANTGKTKSAAGTADSHD